MANIKTIYRIRAQIPAAVVERSGLLSKAREIGLNLAIDDEGNVEGAWEASLLNLAVVLDTLREAGLESPLVQKRVITLAVVTVPSKTREASEILRRFGVSQSKDVFSNESVLGCNVSCEEAEGVLNRLREAGVGKVIATESFEVVTTSND